MNDTGASGSCLCGGVSFRIAFPTKWVAHCHCTRCQRAHGAAFVTWAGVNDSQVEISDTEHLLRWYTGSELGRRGSCSRCGSPMFFCGERWPGELHIARALFVDPLDREPQMHGYYDTHVQWVALGDELPRKPAPV